jgi:hypothetical protein
MKRTLGLAMLALLSSATAMADAAYTGWSKRDPFTDSAETAAASAAPRQIVSPEAIGKNIQVTGISYSETNPKAIVNGKVLGIGDEVGKLGRIARIERDGIAMNVNGQEFFFKQTLGKPTNEPVKNPQA